jgi:DNA repair exonuclease SbcCD ATPase subunit
MVSMGARESFSTPGGNRRAGVGAAMTNKANVTSKYEEERLRTQEQSQIVYLQGQIDELRRQIKDQTNKYNWAMEQVHKVEGSVAQIEGLYDRYRQEVSQALDGYRRDIAVLRKEVAGALVKIEEGSKPIREILTQIHQLGEARKQDRDQVAGWLVRIEELEQRSLAWQARVKESEERHRALASQIDGFHTVDEALRAELRKFNEELQIEKQSLRRQAVEAQQLVADIRPILDDHHSRLIRLDEIRQQIDLFTAELPSRIDVLDARIADQVGEIKRVERVSTERFLMNQERLEEVRQQHEERVVALQDTDEQHLRQLTAWLERIDGWLRDLDQRQARATGRFESLIREQQATLGELDQRDLQIVDTLATTLKQQLERLKAAQIERGTEQPGRPG